MSRADESPGSKFRVLFYLLGTILFLQILFFTSVILHGGQATITWIKAHPALTVFVTAGIFAIAPVYNDTGSKLKRIWKETSKATLLITLASFFVYYRSFVITPDGPFEAMLYNIGGRAWYFTGLMLALNLIGLPVTSYLSNDD